MFPQFSPPIQLEQDKTITLGKCFKFDFEKGKHIIVDGKFVECNFKDNIKHFIQCVLRTKADTFKVYIQDEEEPFGLSIHNNIGDRQLPKGFVLSETKREITEQLTNHPFIKDVDSFDFNFERTVLTIKFNVYLENKETLVISEVIDFGL